MEIFWVKTPLGCGMQGMFLVGEKNCDTICRKIRIFLSFFLLRAQPLLSMFLILAIAPIWILV